MPTLLGILALALSAVIPLGTARVVLALLMSLVNVRRSG
jgi:hypothetical protein